MVLNSHGIEPTFLKLDSWSLGEGFIQNIQNFLLPMELKKYLFSYLYLRMYLINLCKLKGKNQNEKRPQIEQRLNS